MDLSRLVVLLFYAVEFSIGAFLHFRNAFYHKHEIARRSYRVFIGSVSLVTALAALLVLSGFIPQPVPLLFSFFVISSLGVCIIVVGAVEW